MPKPLKFHACVSFAVEHTISDGRTVLARVYRGKDLTGSRDAEITARLGSFGCYELFEDDSATHIGHVPTLAMAPAVILHWVRRSGRFTDIHVITDFPPSLLDQYLL